MHSLSELKQKFEAVWPLLDERTRRLMAASEAVSLGYGGISLVHRACALSRNTIAKGIGELQQGHTLPAGRLRRAGTGRKSLLHHDPLLLEALEQLVAPETRGDPQSALLWCCKSTRNLATELTAQGHRVSHTKVAQLLRGLGYSLQGNAKTLEGSGHPDRNAQFEHINTQVEQALAQEVPVISVDTKKKELIGPYKNVGQQWQPQGEATPVLDHDFPAPDVPRAYPYGIYDVARNRGFVSIGTDHDTAAFAVASIRGWWRAQGRELYATATRLLITADGGGSNGWRLWAWKLELQKFADESGLSIEVCHFPPGTSKWNKIEHRLFSFISSNWSGQPLCNYETIVNLIANTTTAKGLKVLCRLDRRRYPLAQKVSEAQMKLINLVPNVFHGEWNYTIKPQM